MSSVSEQLCRKLEPAQIEINRLHHALLVHPRRAVLYQEYLVGAHIISKSFKPLMNTVLKRARGMSRRDAVAAAMAAYLHKHIADESDEDMLVDLEALGLAREEIERRPIAPSIAALVGAQYFWALQLHPVALLGSLQVLEGYPPSVRLVDELVTRTGLPASGFRSMYEHADLDIIHRDEVHRLLDSLSLTPEQETLIGISALQTVDLLCRAFSEIFERHAESPA
jgi:pyrroloquinoline quinone (PQQ) biosynthesis protein C